MCVLHPHDLFFIDRSSYLLILFTHFLPSHSSIVYVGACRFCFFRFCMLYLSFPVWLISLSICPQDPSMLSEMAIFHSFLWLNSILLYMYTTLSLSIDSSMECWVMYFLAIVNHAAVNVGVHLFNIPFHFLWINKISISLELLDHIVFFFMVVLFLIFWGSTILFSIVAARYYIPTNRAQGFLFLHTFSNMYYFLSVWW